MLAVKTGFSSFGIVVLCFMHWGKLNNGYVFTYIIIKHYTYFVYLYTTMTFFNHNYLNFMKLYCELNTVKKNVTELNLS